MKIGRACPSLAGLAGVHGGAYIRLVLGLAAYRRRLQISDVTVRGRGVGVPDRKDRRTEGSQSGSAARRRCDKRRGDKLTPGRGPGRGGTTREAAAAAANDGDVIYIVE